MKRLGDSSHASLQQSATAKEVNRGLQTAFVLQWFLSLLIKPPHIDLKLSLLPLGPEPKVIYPKYLNCALFASQNVEGWPFCRNMMYGRTSNCTGQLWQLQ